MTSWWSRKEHTKSDFENGLFNLSKIRKTGHNKTALSDIVIPVTKVEEKEPLKPEDKFTRKVRQTFLHPLGPENLLEGVRTYFASNTQNVDPTALYNYQQLLKHTPEPHCHLKEKEVREERDTYQRSSTSTPKFVLHKKKKQPSVIELSTTTPNHSCIDFGTRDQYQHLIENTSKVCSFEEEKRNSLNESGFNKLFDSSKVSSKGQKRKMGNFTSIFRRSKSPSRVSHDNPDIEVLEQYVDALKIQTTGRSHLPPGCKLVPYDDSIIIPKDDDSVPEVIDYSFIDKHYFPKRETVTRSYEVQPFPVDNEIVQKGLNNTKIYEIDVKRSLREYRYKQEDILRKAEREKHESHGYILEHNRYLHEIENEIKSRDRIGAENIVVDYPKGSDSFPALPAEAEELIGRAWQRHANEDEVFVDTSSVKITRKDLKTLHGLDWLNDEVINFYLNLVVQRSKEDTSLPKVYAFQTFFYASLTGKGYASVKRWTRKVDIFAYDLWIVPVHLTHHWCMAIVDIQNQRIEYYDSMLGNNRQVFEVLSSYISCEMKDKKKQDISTDGWERACRKDIPTQQNGSDCGMFACKFAEYASRRAPIDFNQKQMPYFRKRMVWEICQQRLM